MAAFALLLACVQQYWLGCAHRIVVHKAVTDECPQLAQCSHADFHLEWQLWALAEYDERPLIGIELDRRKAACGHRLQRIVSRHRVPAPDLQPKPLPFGLGVWQSVAQLINLVAT